MSIMSIYQFLFLFLSQLYLPLLTIIKNQLVSFCLHQFPQHSASEAQLPQDFHVLLLELEMTPSVLAVVAMHHTGRLA